MPRSAIVYDQEGTRIGLVGDHLVVVHELEVQEEGALVLERRATELARRAPGRSCYLAVLGPKAGTPGAEARNAYIRMGQQVSETLGCMAVVYLASGFFVAAQRAAVSSLALAARVRFPIKTFSSIETAALWAGERLGHDLAQTHELGAFARSLAAGVGDAAS